MIESNVWFSPVVASTLVGLSLAWICLRQNRQILSLKQRFQNLEEKIAQVGDSGIGVGRKVVSLDKRLKMAERRQKEIEATDPSRVSYNEAMKLLALGADTKDLVANCGLSKAEADLMSALYLGQTSRH